MSDRPPIIRNKDTVYPEAIFVELLRTQEEDEYVYYAQLVLVVDQEQGLFFNIPLECVGPRETILNSIIRSTLTMFSSIGSVVPVLDLDTGELLEKINLNQHFKIEDKNESLFSMMESTTIH